MFELKPLSVDAIPAALEAYQAKRQPIVEKLIAAANASAAWYEQFASHMDLEPLELAMNYITRSGRVDDCADDMPMRPD